MSSIAITWDTQRCDDGRKMSISASLTSGHLTTSRLIESLFPARLGRPAPRADAGEGKPLGALVLAESRPAEPDDAYCCELPYHAA
ncbi:MAG TPA: hypothetical protein VFU94_14950 [Conexibacter sp.]|nr:hypothetical protein [Conexibacter sp.]